jgi:hypothetical protein
MATMLLSDQATNDVGGTCLVQGSLSVLSMDVVQIMNSIFRVCANHVQAGHLHVSVAESRFREAQIDQPNGGRGCERRDAGLAQPYCS